MRRPQFTLKTLLWLTVVVAAFCAGTQLDRYMKDRADLSHTNIRKALNEKTEFNFTEVPLDAAISYLKEQHDVEIHLDNWALLDAGISSEAPITRSVKGVPLRSALSQLLDQLDLTYVIQNGAMIITTKRAAKGDWYSLKTLMWVSAAIAVLLGTILIRWTRGRRLEPLDNPP